MTDGMRRIAVKLTVSFLAVIVMVSALFSIVGTRIINDRIVAEAEMEVGRRHDSAVNLYQEALGDIKDVVRFAAMRFFLRGALLDANVDAAADELDRIRSTEQLDLLAVTDRDGTVLLRVSNPEGAGDSHADDQYVGAVLAGREPVAGTRIMPYEDLETECPGLAGSVGLPDGDPFAGTAGIPATAGMVMYAAAPILGYHEELIGVIYGGVLLNARSEVTASIAATVFDGIAQGGDPPPVMALYQGDILISADTGGPGLQPAWEGTADREAYEQTVAQGGAWLGRTRLDDVAYFSGFGSIAGLDGASVGMIQVGIPEAPYRDQQRRTTMLFLAITLGGALLVLVLSSIVSRRISGPIRRLVAASHRVAGGDFEARVAVASRDELADLAHSFNSMALALQERMAQIAEFATSRVKESERLAVVGQLAAGVAHELNNPLQGIVAYGHLLLEQTDADDPRRIHLEKIVAQAGRSTAIIQGLLDFARPRTPLKRPADLNSVLRDTISLVADQSLFHNIMIESRLDADLPPVVVDASQMQQVFMNLIINAAEAMEGGGRLLLTTKADPDGRWVEACVADTGRGIAAEDQSRIFDPFFSTKDVMHGTGLGLAISYGIVREHGGTITVDSRLGAGAAFRVRVPLPGRAPDGGVHAQE